MENVIESLYMDDIDSRIKHLDEQSIKEMIGKYYDGVTVTQLKNDYNINVSASSFINLFPKKVTGEICEYCNENLVEKWKSKNGYSLTKNRPYCPICNHENHDMCKCNTCEKLRKEALVEEEKRKKSLIQIEYDESNYGKVLEEDLNLEDRLFLAVLVRAGLDENIGYIIPLDEINEKLTPTNEFTIELIKTLTGRSLIIPHPSSSIHGFKDDENFPNTYYLNKVKFRLNIKSSDGNYYNMVQRIMYPSSEDFENDGEFCFNMWKRIALNESLEYLLYSLEKVGFDFNPGEKTKKVFENLIQHYSVAQIYSIIYKGVANSTKLYQEKRMPKKHAANTVITFCESYGERALAEGWNLAKYRRDFNLPETLIYKVFFTSILKIAYIGFEEKPTTNL